MALMVRDDEHTSAFGHVLAAKHADSKHGHAEYTAHHAKKVVPEAFGERTLGHFEGEIRKAEGGRCWRTNRNWPIRGLPVDSYSPFRPPPSDFEIFSLTIASSRSTTSCCISPSVENWTASVAATSGPTVRELSLRSRSFCCCSTSSRA